MHTAIPGKHKSSENSKADDTSHEKMSNRLFTDLGKSIGKKEPEKNRNRMHPVSLLKNGIIPGILPAKKLMDERNRHVLMI